MSHVARNKLGYDDPWHRDWLFWTVLVASLTGVGIGIGINGFQWQHPFQLLGGVVIGGVLLSSLREAIRGYREARPKA